MKRIFYIIGLSINLIHGAATEEQSSQSWWDSMQIVIAQKPATVANAMISQGVSNTSQEALDSPVGKLYAALNDNPKGINSLGEERIVVFQTKKYNDEIQAHETLKELAAFAKSLKAENAPEAERIMALTLFGAEYGTLLKELVKKDIPDLTLFFELKSTIEKNTEVTLGDGQTICLKAAQLAMGGLNLQEQWEIDPTTFELMFKRYLTDTSGKSLFARLLGY